MSSKSGTVARLQAKLQAKKGDTDRIRVIDLTMYNGEPIMELRLKYLYDHVDEFVVVESRETHSGSMKPYLFMNKERELFEKYKDKVTKIVIDKFPDEYPYVLAYGPDRDAWKRENYARDYAYNTYIKEKYKEQQYIILCCDCDELPRSELVKNIRQFYSTSVPIFMDMHMLRYNFRWLHPNIHWTHPFIVNDKLAALTELSRIRTGIQRQAIVPNAGWHCSYFLTIGDNVRKLESFAHSEYNKSEFKDRDLIKMCMLTGRFHLKPDGTDRLAPYTEVAYLPEGWEDFQNKLDDLVFREEIAHASKP